MTDQAGSPAAAPLVLFAEYTDLDPEPARQLLATQGVATELLQLDADGRITESQRGAIGIIAGYSQINADLIAQLPKLGIIAASSNGTNMIDLEAAADRGIWVTNVGHAATEEVAVHTLTLALALLREIPAMTRVVAEGQWTDDLAVVPRRISELRFGLIGYGRIGAELARMTSPLFAQVCAYDPFNSPSDGNAVAADFEDVLSSCDVVSLHLPLTPDTEGMIGAAEIAKMRRGSILLNPSRGELVDLDACRAALDNGQLGGIGFDVLRGEPPVSDDPLRTHPRAIVTPHAAFLSDASLLRYETDPAQYIADWLATGAPSACVVLAPTAA